MKAHLQILTASILLSVEGSTQTGNAATANSGNPLSPSQIDLSQDTAYMTVLGSDENICLDSLGNELYFKIPISPNGTVLEYLCMPQHYPAFQADGNPYLGEQYSAEMPNSVFNIYLDSLREADFCFSDSASAEDGYLSNRVMDFVYNLKGRKVGTGICFDLVKEANEYADSNWMRDKWENREKYEVQSSDIEEGDVILFDNVLLADSALLPAHIGIVCRVLEGGGITYADQNSCGGEEDYIQYYRKYEPVYKYSRVVMNDLDLRQDIISGTVKFYRF